MTEDTLKDVTGRVEIQIKTIKTACMISWLDRYYNQSGRRIASDKKLNAHMRLEVVIIVVIVWLIDWFEKIKRKMVGLNQD